MPKLWRSLLGRNEVARYGVDDYATDLQSAFYNGQILGGSGAWSRTEDLETNFTGYIQQIYKTNGPTFAIILSRMLLFTEAVFCWWEIGDNGDTGLPAGRAGLGPLERPWPRAGTGELLARMEQDVSLAGNFYAAREDNRLRRLRPDWVTIVLNKPPAEATEVDVEGYWFHPGRHYTAVDEPQPGDTFYPVESEDTDRPTGPRACHWSPIPDPDALYRGMSWLQPVVNEVMADKAATLHKKKFFDNGATLGTVIAAKENLTKKQFDVWRDTILAQHQGVDRAYRPLFLASPVDVTVQGTNLNQLDFKVTQGAGETRLCAAGGVPPIIVGLSEGLASATYSNYSMARRKFGDHWASPQWRSASAALEAVVDPPKDDLRLGVNTANIPFLREDQKDAADIQQIKASTIRQYIDAGFTPESSVAAVDADDRSLLEHSGMYSVQLQPPGSQDPEPEAPEEEPHADEMADAALVQAQLTAVKAGVDAGFEPESLIKAVEAGDISMVKLADDLDDEVPVDEFEPADGEDPTASRADESWRLHKYWTSGPGLARWVNSPHPFKTLLAFLKRHMPDARARQTTYDWFKEVKGFAPSGRPPGYEGVEEFGEMEDTTEDPAGTQSEPATRRPWQANTRTNKRKRKVRRSEDPDDELERANQLKEYWTQGEGLARWATWTQLYTQLREHVSDERAKRIAAEWYHERYGIWPGHTKGKNPTGPG